MASRELSYDPVTKIRSVFHDLGGDKYVVEETQDVQAILDMTGRDYNTFSHKSVRKFGNEHMHLVGSIPMVELNKIMAMCGDDQVAINKAIRTFLNNNEKLKTRPVKL